MDPKSNAGTTLASLSNSINTGGGFGSAPQYTPAGTPPVMPSEPARAMSTYAPPSFGSHVPAATQPVPSPAPYAPTPTPQTPISTPTFGRVIPPQMQQPQSTYQPAPSYAELQNQAPRKSRFVAIVMSMFACILLLVTGLLYLYGSSIVAQQRSGLPTSNPATGAQALPLEIPTNGFQVTESGVNEPNFDQQLPIDAGIPTTRTVNTDVENMFAE